MWWLFLIILIICVVIAIKIGIPYCAITKIGGNEPHLEPVSKGNLQKILQLEVNESQTEYVASIKDALVQASFLKNWHGYALIDGDNVVGFGSFADYDKVPGTVKIYKVIGDRRHQGRGVGKLLVDELISRASTPNLYIDVHNDNIAALNLYKKQFDIVSADSKNTVLRLKN